MFHYFKRALKVTIFSCILIRLQAMEIPLDEEKLDYLIKKFISETSQIEESSACVIDTETGEQECFRSLNAHLTPLNARFGCFKERDLCWLSQVGSTKGFELSGIKAKLFGLFLAQRKNELSMLSAEEMQRIMKGDENCAFLWYGLAGIKKEKDIVQKKVELKNSRLNFRIIPSLKMCCVKVNDSQSACFDSCDLNNSHQYEFPEGIPWEMIEIRLQELRKEQSEPQ